jgi:hypothetical protein
MASQPLSRFNSSLPHQVAQFGSIHPHFPCLRGEFGANLRADIDRCARRVANRPASRIALRAVFELYCFALWSLLSGLYPWS